MAIVKIKRVRFTHVSGFLIYNDKAVVLVDTGHTKTVNRFTEAVRELGKSPSDIALIVLTHTHFDHAGGARRIKEITGAPVAVHKT
jgi:glyoxylase-like metal-dependent hydrolase (beta-lactamase superfamily II)